MCELNPIEFESFPLFNQRSNSIKFLHFFENVFIVMKNIQIAKFFWQMFKLFNYFNSLVE